MQHFAAQLFHSHCFSLFLSSLFLSSCSCHSLWCPLIMSSWPVLPTLPSRLMPHVLPSSPCPPLLSTTSFATSSLNRSLSVVRLLCLCPSSALTCSFSVLALALCTSTFLIPTLFALNPVPSVTCPCRWLPIPCLSSAHGGLPPTPAAGVPCPPSARHGHRGQAHQAAGQLLRGGDPKDGRLSLWGGH